MADAALERAPTAVPWPSATQLAEADTYFVRIAERAIRSRDAATALWLDGQIEAAKAEIDAYRKAGEIGHTRDHVLRAEGRISMAEKMKREIEGAGQ